VLQGGILDVLDRLEKWCDFSCHLALLFSFRAGCMDRYL
jgi:hypothetical protein